MLQFRAGLRIPSAALEERRNVGHDEAETVQNRPGDGNALKPCAGIIHGLAVLGKVHQQQGNGGADYSCDGGDRDDLRVDIFYNKDAFDACGITDTPKTWDEFLTVCQTLKDNGYEPLALDGAYANFNFYNHLVRHLGEDTIAELGKNGGWADNEAAVTAAQEIIDFVNAGYLAEGAPDAYPASQTKVGLGTAAMVACANYVTSEVDAAVGEPVNWGFFNYPEVEGNVDASAYAGANSLAISSSCENPQAAFDFIMTIVTGTCGQELVDNGGQIPADTRLKESVLAGSVETLKNTTTPMSWCGALNTLDGWSSIKSSMIELFEGKYATGADYCAYLDTLCG